MGKKVAWSDRAKGQLRAIDQATALQILHTLGRHLSPGEGDVKRLQDIEPPEFRSSMRQVFLAQLKNVSQHACELLGAQAFDADANYGRPARSRERQQGVKVRIRRDDDELFLAGDFENRHV